MIASPALALNYEQELATLPHNLPKEIRDFIDRRASCLYFSGELPGHEGERQAEIEGRIKELRCSTVGQDETSLKRRYAKNPVGLNALNISTAWQMDD
jgi:hypothetical protein